MILPRPSYWRHSIPTALVTLFLVGAALSRAQITTVGSFNSTDGANPYGSVILNGGTLYGTTYNGGANSDGTVFSVPVTGGTPTVIASFNSTNGSGPDSTLTLSGSTLYGTTPYGGANGDGTVFSAPVGGGAITDLASFNNTNGETPMGSLLLNGPTLYGATQYGGANSDGTVFSMQIPEPGSGALLATGILAAALLRRRRRGPIQEKRDGAAPRRVSP